MCTGVVCQCKSAIRSLRPLASMRGQSWGSLKIPYDSHSIPIPIFNDRDLASKQLFNCLMIAFGTCFYDIVGLDPLGAKISQHWVRSSSASLSEKC